MSKSKLVSVEEISKHNSSEDCWIVVDGHVWDITGFAPSHPGGPAIIYKHAGHDATKAYSEIHGPSLIATELDSSEYMGNIDTSTITEEWAKPPVDEEAPELMKEERPPLAAIINAHDFEAVSERRLTKKTWAFYSSGATDAVTRDANQTYFQRVWFRPRLLRNMKTIDTSCKVFGCDLTLPLFVAPAALARLAHPEGEKALARACANKGIIQCICSNASFGVSEIAEATPKDYPSFFQLYVNTDRPKTESLLKEIMSLGSKIRAVFLTIDVPAVGKREPDERLKADESISSTVSGGRAGNDSKGGGLARSMGSYIDPGLTWADLEWIKKQIGPDMPLVLKGIQSVDDARMALEAGRRGLVQGVCVSNHGGRSLDGAPPAICMLNELRKVVPEMFERMEVFLDSGVRRGTDILKCLCLGAKAVGIGRSFLYSLEYGEEGVEHLIELLRDELETSMKLIGTGTIKDVDLDYLNTADIDRFIPGYAGTRREKARI